MVRKEEGENDMTDFIAGGYVSTLRFADGLVKRGHSVVFK